MSEKKRQKKAGRDKNKDNQARRREKPQTPSSRKRTPARRAIVTSEEATESH
jgi:hypothetical protein